MRLFLLLICLALLGSGLQPGSAQTLPALDAFLDSGGGWDYPLISWSADSQLVLVSEGHTIKSYQPGTVKVRSLLTDPQAKLYAPLLKGNQLLVMRVKAWDQSELGVYSLAQRRYQKILPEVWAYHDCRAAQKIYTINGQGIRALDLGRLQTTSVLAFRHDYARQLGYGLACGASGQHVYFISGKRDIYGYDAGGQPIEDYYPQIWEKRPGQHTRVLVKFMGISSDYRFRSLRLSDDARRLAWTGGVMLSLYAFELPEPPSAWKTLAGMEVNGDPPIAYLPDAPVWLPDKRLLFVGASYLPAQDRWLQQAYVIDPRTRHLRSLAGTEGMREPVLSPDGKTLAYFQPVAGRYQLRWRALNSWPGL